MRTIFNWLLLDWDSSESKYLPIEHTSARPVQPILFETFAVVAFEHFEHTDYVAGRRRLCLLETAHFILAEDQWRSTDGRDLRIHIQRVRSGVSAIIESFAIRRP